MLALAAGRKDLGGGWWWDREVGGGQRRPEGMMTQGGKGRSRSDTGGKSRTRGQRSCWLTRSDSFWAVVYYLP